MRSVLLPSVVLAALAMMIASCAGKSAPSGAVSAESRQAFAQKIQKTYTDDDVPLVVTTTGTDSTALIIDGRECRMIDIGVSRYQADKEMHDMLRGLGFRRLTIEYVDPKPKTIEVDLTR